jgi:hypothetical protein
MTTIIYTDGDYSITLHGKDQAKISKGNQTQIIRLKAASETLGAINLKAMKKAGLNPADYAEVDGVIIRRAALDSWTAAVAARRIERQAETAAQAAADAALIASQGQRALILHGAYLLEQAIAYVVVIDDQTARTVGDWTAIEREPVNALLDAGINGPRRGLNGLESSVIIITAAQWDGLIAASATIRAERAAVKAATIQAAADRIATAQAKAAATGQAQEIDCELIETETEDGLVWLRRMIRADGTTYTARTICA